MTRSATAQGILRARKAAAATLVAALRSLPSNFTELDLATAWLRNIASCDDLLPFGWYQPPPHGMSVLIAHSPSFERLTYQSLRDEENWPSASVASDDCAMLYPYFSAIDRETAMIGDFVGTFYSGDRPDVREWMAEVLGATLRIASHAKVGRPFSELFEYAASVMGSLGAKNNTFSASGGLASDIGHTVPGFGEPSSHDFCSRVLKQSPSDIARTLASARTFVSQNNHERISPDCAFTIEPQLLIDGLPMASFHVIVIFADGQRSIVHEFEDVFEHFGMNDWIAPRSSLV